MTKKQGEAIRWIINRVRRGHGMEWTGGQGRGDWTWHPMHPIDIEDCLARCPAGICKQAHSMEGA